MCVCVCVCVLCACCFQTLVSTQRVLESAPQGRRRLQSFFPKSGAWYRPRICSTASPCSQKYLLRPSQKDFLRNVKISKNQKNQIKNFKSCQKKSENFGIFKFGKNKYSCKKNIDFRPKTFRPYVEKCQNPLLIPYRNCGRSAHAHAVLHFSRGESADVQRPRRVLVGQGVR